jgi:hypothetical protein
LAADAKNDTTFRYCGSLASGPISVSSARGSPRRIDAARLILLPSMISG